MLGTGLQSLAAKNFTGIEQRAGVKDSLASFRVWDLRGKKRSIFRKIRPDRTLRRGKLQSPSDKKNWKDYVMRKSTPTLTQSGLLAVLLQRQRYKISQLASRRAQRKHMRDALWSTLTWPGRALTGPMPVRHSRRVLRRIPPAPLLNLLPRSIAMSHQIHTYTELQQQIHDDLRIQHPEWIESSGKSPMCDSYEACLTGMLDTLTRRGSNEVIVPAHRALEQAVTGS